MRQILLGFLVNIIIVSVFALKENITNDWDASDYSSSESSNCASWEGEYMQPKPKLETPPASPFLPFFVGFGGRPIQAPVDAAVRLATSAADAVVPGPSAPEALAYFSTLTRVVRTMSAVQIVRAGSSLVGLPSALFRDSVAQAGTGPALLAIKSWILGKEFTGEEAARLVAVLPETARYPTEDYIKAFFELVTSPQVAADPGLNATSILALYDLLGRSLASSRSAHSQYPVHSFGRPTPKVSGDAIVRFHVGWLAQQLKDALNSRDGHRSQIFIRALGNIPHPSVFSVFEPYLEGQEDMSNFQRLLIVTCLDRIVINYPRLARIILFKIYQNIGEAVEIRVAAVGQLMKTDPPVEMLLRMAEYTNYEQNSQINSAVKSAIETAAMLLKSPNHHHLSEKAKEASNILTTKEYGIQYSKNYLSSFTEDNLGYFLKLGTIQSPNSVIPSSILYTLQTIEGGFKMKPSEFNLMMSSGDDLMDLAFGQFEELVKELHQGKGRRSNSNVTDSETQWTANKVASMLSVEADSPRPVEANLMVELFGGKRFFALDNRTVNKIPQRVKEASSWLKNGEHFNLTKMYNQFSIKIGFPTEMGLPFVYSIQKPTLFSLTGEGSLKTQPDLTGGSQKQIHIPQIINASIQFSFTYSSKEQSKVGFITPFDHQRYFLGYEKNIHIYIPLSVQASMDLINRKALIQMKVLEPNKRHKLAEYSSVAYTTKHNILNLSPPLYSKRTKIINLKPLIKQKFNIGKQKLGFCFDMKIENQESFSLKNVISKFLTMRNPLHALIFLTKDKSINPHMNYTVWFNPQKTTANHTVISIAYDEGHDLKGNVEENEENSNNSTQPISDSLKRLFRYIYSSKFGIKDSYSQGVDMSVEFVNNNMKLKYILTSAYSMSPLSTMSKLLLAVKKEFQNSTYQNKIHLVDLKLENTMPLVPLTNYSLALETDPSSHSQTEISFGNGNDAVRIKILGLLNQTKASKVYLEESSLSKLCKSQMQEGNYILQACRNLTARANFIDNYSFEIDTLKIPDEWKHVGHTVYSVLREMFYPYFYEDIVSKRAEVISPVQKYRVNMSLSPDHQSLNVFLDVPTLNAKIQNVPINKWVQLVLSIHPEYNIFERLSNEVLLLQHYPTCSIDKTYTTTFDNKTYPINFGKCWHVVFQSLPKYQVHTDSGMDMTDEYEPISVLMRDSDKDEREIMIFFGNEVVSLYPSLEFVTVNGEKIDVESNTINHMDNSKGDSFMEIHKLVEGSLYIKVPRLGLEIIYDNIRVKLQVSNFYRGEVRGLCGTFDGEKTTDFTSPRNCILMDPYDFAGSYAITDGSCSGHARILRHHSITAQCYEKVVILGDVISEKETGSFKVKSNYTVKGEMSLPCTHYKIKVLERDNSICFSIRPQEACASFCKTTSKIEQMVDFHCIEDSLLARHWADIVRRGANPDFTKKGSNLRQPISLPQTCVPV